MMIYKPLSDNEVRAISAAYFAERAPKSQAQEQPTIVLVGAQPGAGKSGAADFVRAELAMRGGFIHVDADRMRERIPLAGGNKPTSEQTQPDAGRLAVALRGLAIQERRNIVEEGTFRKPDDAAKFIQDMRAQGYKVELMGVATSREESLLGIYSRHEKQHEAGSKNPRFVSEAYHDEAMQGFDTTVAKTSAQLDRVRVVNRTGEMLYDSSTPHHNRQANALEAMAAGRKITDDKLAAISKEWASIAERAAARGAALDYRHKAADHAQRVTAIKDERIHNHAMKQLDSNLAALGKDPRYARHSGDELVKAAYFRGVHEKASEIEGKPVAFEKFDARMSDRATLAKLPDMPDLEGRQPTAA